MPGRYEAEGALKMRVMRCALAIAGCLAAVTLFYAPALAGDCASPDDCSAIPDNATRATGLLAIGAGIFIGAKILRRARPGSVPLGDEDDEFRSGYDPPRGSPDDGPPRFPEPPSAAPDPGPPESPKSTPFDAPLGEDEGR
jgi:hypothetical protein